MSVPRSRQRISRARRSSIFVNRAPRKSSTTANRRSGNMRLPAKRANSAGPKIAFSSSTRISAYPAPVRWHDPALRVSLLRLLSPTLGSCLASKCRALRATMPIGIASSILPASPTR